MDGFAGWGVVEAIGVRSGDDEYNWDRGVCLSAMGPSGVCNRVSLHSTIPKTIND